MQYPLKKVMMLSYFGALIIAFCATVMQHYIAAWDDKAASNICQFALPTVAADLREDAVPP